MSAACLIQNGDRLACARIWDNNQVTHLAQNRLVTVRNENQKVRTTVRNIEVIVNGPPCPERDWMDKALGIDRCGG